MTRVRFFVTKENIYKGFSVQGHVGYADHGQDIVCSALSALSTSCANSIEKLAEQIPRVDENQEDGVLSVMFDFEPNEKTILFMDSFKLAVEQIRQVYSAYITLEVLTV